MVFICISYKQKNSECCSWSDYNPLEILKRYFLACNYLQNNEIFIADFLNYIKNVPPIPLTFWYIVHELKTLKNHSIYISFYKWRRIQNIYMVLKAYIMSKYWFWFTIQTTSVLQPIVFSQSSTLHFYSFLIKYR